MSGVSAVDSPEGVSAVDSPEFEALLRDFAHPTTDPGRRGALDSDDAKLPRSGDVIADKYQIEERLGEGGFGTVFRARHNYTGKRVAIKWLRASLGEEGQTRFLREARAAGSIDHPNVINVFDVGEHQGSSFLVMELLEGRTLRQLMTEGPMSPPQLVAIMVPALRGLAQAHKQGVIHRDLKPENLFLCDTAEGAEPTLKVLDFGISKVLRTVDSEPLLTRQGTALGTPEYMSYEQLKDSQSVDWRTDIYSAGVMMYEALTGARPFQGRSFHAVAMAVEEYRPEPMRTRAPQLPASLEALVMRAMAKDRSQRYPTAEALIEALRPFADPANPLVTPDARPGLPPRARARAFAIGGVAMGLLMLGAWRLSLGAGVAPSASAGGVTGSIGTTASEQPARASSSAPPATVSLEQAASSTPGAVVSAEAPTAEPAPASSSASGAVPAAAVRAATRSVGSVPAGTRRKPQPTPDSNATESERPSAPAPTPEAPGLAAQAASVASPVDPPPAAVAPAAGAAGPALHHRPNLGMPLLLSDFESEKPRAK